MSNLRQSALELDDTLSFEMNKNKFSIEIEKVTQEYTDMRILDFSLF